MSRTFRSSDRCQDALGLAHIGYRVFPCKERGKAPLTANGFKAATRDEQKILHYWDRWPSANVGVACEASGVTVVDIDTKAGADPSEVLAELGDIGSLTISWTGEAPEPDDEHPSALAGERGAHVWFSGVTATGRTQWPGVELRSRGAYVIAPCSAHPSGVPYQWRGDRPVSVGRLAALPDNVSAQAKVTLVEPVPDTIPAGERHDGLLALAGSLLVRRVFEPDLLAGALLEANRVRSRPPIAEDEVRAIARWAANCETARDGRLEAELARRLFEAWREQDTRRSA